MNGMSVELDDAKNIVVFREDRLAGKVYEWVGLYFVFPKKGLSWATLQR
jgi:hypothetical protein